MNFGLTTDFYTPPPVTHRYTHTHAHTHGLLSWVITTLLCLHKIASKCNQASQLAPLTFSPLLHLFCASVALFHSSFSSYLSFFPPFPQFTSFPNFSFSCLSSPSPSTSDLEFCFFSVLPAYFLIASSACFLRSSTYLIYVCHKSSLLFSLLCLFSLCNLQTARLK